MIPADVAKIKEQNRAVDRLLETRALNSAGTFQALQAWTCAYSGGRPC